MSVIVGLLGVGCMAIAAYVFLNPTYWFHDTWVVEDNPELGEVVSVFIRLGCIPTFLMGLVFLGHALT